MTKKEPEVQIKTSMKNAGAFVKVLLAALGAMGFGAAGSALTSSTGVSAQEDRLAKLEEACSNYDIRLATAETKIDDVQLSLVDIKKDLAEIRSTNTQILFILRSK